jgi:hypothetical protein
MAIKAMARGHAWFEELVSGRARSLQELAKRDGISGRYGQPRRSERDGLPALQDHLDQPPGSRRRGQ